MTVEITHLERAQLRLKAFELLKGYGTRLPPDANGDEKFIPNNIEQQKKQARELADWAISDEAEAEPELQTE